MKRAFEYAMGRVTALVFSIGFFVLIVAPQIAQACAVCSAGREDDTRTAFIVSTAGMTLLPLVLVGGLIWWIRRRLLETEHAEIPERRPQGRP